MQGVTNNAANGNRVDPTLTADLEFGMVFFEHGRGFIHLEGALGTGLNDDAPFVTNIFGLPNTDANPGQRQADMELAEAYFEFEYWNNSFFLTVGLLDPVVYFDNNAVANDETTQFLNSGLVNNSAIALPGYSLGMVIRYKATAYMNLQAGIFEGDSDWDNIQRDPFYIGEVDFHTNFGDKEGNYRFYVWRNHTNNPAGYGFGMSLDQQAAAWLTFFARFGYASPSIYQNKMSFAGGVEFAGALFKRHEDAIGLAINSDTVAAGDNESLLELYYRLQLGDHLALSPDIQWYMNPGASAANSKALVGSLRAQVDF